MYEERKKIVDGGSWIVDGGWWMDEPVRLIHIFYGYRDHLT
jgi:hypothetical protein